MAKGLEIKKTGKTNVPVIQKDIVNQDETVEALDNMRKQIADPANYQQNFLSVLKDIKETAKYYCPKDTHALANSIRLIKNDSEQKLDKSLAKSKSILNYTFIAGNPNKKNSKGKPINYGCITDNDYILKDNDKLVNYKQLLIGDNIFSYGSFEKIENIFFREYNGNIFKIYRHKYTSLPLELTAEHKVFAIQTIICDKHKGYNYVCNKNCKYHNRKNRVYLNCNKYEKYVPKWIEAQNLKVGDYLISPRLKGIIDDDKIDSDLCRLIGYFLSEGSIDGKYYVRFAFNNKEESFVTDVDNIMFKYFNKHTSNPRIIDGVMGGCIVLCYCSKEAVNFFKQFYITEKKKRESGMKYLPKKFLYLPIQKQASILCGLYRGDGLKTCPNRQKLTTVSNILAEQVKIILERIGIPVSLRIGKRINTKNAYHIEITGKPLYDFQRKIDKDIIVKIGNKNREYFIITDEYIAYPIRKIEKEYVQNKEVVDLQIKNKHSFVTNGCLISNSWVHDGHFMPSGRWWSGVPFFKLALEAHREELDEAIDKVWKKLGKKFSNENNKKK